MCVRREPAHVDFDLRDDELAPAAARPSRARARNWRHKGKRAPSTQLFEPGCCRTPPPSSRRQRRALARARARIRRERVNAGPLRLIFQHYGAASAAPSRARARRLARAG